MIRSGRPALWAVMSVAFLATAMISTASAANIATTASSQSTSPSVRSAPEPPEPDEPVEPDDDVLDLMAVMSSPALARANGAWNGAKDAEQRATDDWVTAEQTRLDLWGLKTVADVTVGKGRAELATAQRKVDQEAATLSQLRATEKDRLDVLDDHRGELRRLAAAAFAASPHDDPIGLGTFEEMSRGNRRQAALTAVIKDRSTRVELANERWTTAKEAADEQQGVLSDAEAVRDEKAELLASFIEVRDGYLRLHDEAEITVGERTDELAAAREATVEARAERRAVRLTSTVPGAGFSLVALDAYWRASGGAPCHLPWWLLAGVGWVESGHGTAHGSRVTDTGDTTNHIIGIALDGRRNTAAIRDTDGGLLDNDSTWDRAVGPMQFIPGTWRRWAADGNDDGSRDPHNLYDAAAAAAGYLCNVRGDVHTDMDARVALLAYNNSGPYGLLVVDGGRRFQSMIDLAEVRPADPEPQAATTPD